jgi:hypothetical protein
VLFLIFHHLYYSSDTRYSSPERIILIGFLQSIHLKCFSFANQYCGSFTMSDGMQISIFFTTSIFLKNMTEK